MSGVRSKRLEDWSLVAGMAIAFSLGAIANVWTAQGSSKSALPSRGPIHIEAIPVPLNPQDLAAKSIGNFAYAGGLLLRSRQTDLLRELSDIVMTGPNRFAAVGDEGVLLEARLVLDETGRLVGVTDAELTRLVGQNGRALTEPNADAEGLAVLANGDRLVSFEASPRILRYPKRGGLPMTAPSPRLAFQPNSGMEALAAVPDAGADAYMVGAENTGETWTCRVTTRCVSGPTLEKPREFGLVAMNRIADGVTAYLLRAYDPLRRTRITLKIVRDSTEIARMDMASPLTVDNFEGIASVAGADGRYRLYLLSDDNGSDAQRTLLLAFDWRLR